MEISKRVLITAVYDTLKVTPGLRTRQNFDALTDGLNTLPVLRILPQDWTPNAGSSGGGGLTAQKSFGGAKRQTEITLTVDLIVSQRNHLNQNMAAVIDLSDGLDAILNAQENKPYFGLMDDTDRGLIDSFRWNAERVTFDEGEKFYSGVQYTIVLTVL